MIRDSGFPLWLIYSYTADTDRNASTVG